MIERGEKGERSGSSSPNPFVNKSRLLRNIELVNQKEDEGIRGNPDDPTGRASGRDRDKAG